MNFSEVVEKVRWRIRIGKLNTRRIYGLLAEKDPTILQDELILIAECLRIAPPEDPDFTAGVDYARLYNVGRANDLAVAGYNERIARALLRAREFEKEKPRRYSPLGEEAEEMIFLANYLYELREQKYGTN